MISVEDREKIRRAYFVEHKSLRQIAKELHVARKTIAKAIGSTYNQGFNHEKYLNGVLTILLQLSNFNVFNKCCIS